ncbi:M28 family peptidase [Zhouia sp. PK063]|uniref:M28 family peptidase n=1 Tax=Zhouia sp. PK063 TaxID=3373602 RepID=UPI0037BB31CB
MKKLAFLVLCICSLQFAKAQQEDQTTIKKIYDTQLKDGVGYKWLQYLSLHIGGRLSGSLEAQQAVDYTKSVMDSSGFDKVWLQEVMVPKWVRGLPEFAYIESKPGYTTNVNICALGGSVATPSLGIKANVVEVHSLEELQTLGKAKLEGKIVFFNRPMDPTYVDTFEAYEHAVDQRGSGAREASKYGAVGVIVRSMNLRLDDFPHTGGTNYGDLPPVERIPAAAISTNDAELLSSMLALNPNTKFYFKQNCKQMPDVKSYNVIGEIKGSTYPNQVIVVGAHLDSWDLGQGAQDDGAGCVQSIEVLHLLKKIGYQPKHTIRVVLYMNEENGLRGGLAYGKYASTNPSEKNIFALESDSGGFTPRGFTFECTDTQFQQFESYKPLFAPYLIQLFEKGGAGADIGPLKETGTALAGLKPDSQRYFDHHHSNNDTFDQVNKRELYMGTATMASLIYLIDKYGIKE